MPGKSRQRRGKYSAQARKQNQPLRNNQPAQALSQTPEAVAAPVQSVSARPRRATLMPEDLVIEHPFIGAELKSIGLLSLLVIIVLVVLNFIIS